MVLLYYILIVETIVQNQWFPQRHHSNKRIQAYIVRLSLKVFYSVSPHLHLLFRFSHYYGHRIYRLTFLTLCTNVSYIPKSMGSKEIRFTACLTIYEGYRRNIQIVLYQGRYLVAIFIIA
jgi:hypothetical protein